MRLYTNKRARLERYLAEREWFAWHPVRVGDYWVWWERVRRRRVLPRYIGRGAPVGPWWEYRLVEATDD